MSSFTGQSIYLTFFPWTVPAIELKLDHRKRRGIVSFLFFFTCRSVNASVGFDPILQTNVKTANTAAS